MVQLSISTAQLVISWTLPGLVDNSAIPAIWKLHISVRLPSVVVCNIHFHLLAFPCKGHQVPFCLLCFLTFLSVIPGLLPLWPTTEHVHFLPWLGLYVVSSLIISAVMTTLFTPLINCSFSLLSFSLYLHSVVLIRNLLIHSSAVSSLWLPSLQYWSNNIVSLCYSLNFSFNTLNNLAIVWHGSCALLAHVYMNYSPSPSNQFFDWYLLFMTNFIMLSEEKFYPPSETASVLCTCLWLPSWTVVLFMRAPCTWSHISLMLACPAAVTDLSLPFLISVIVTTTTFVLLLLPAWFFALLPLSLLYSFPFPPWLLISAFYFGTI